jgi:drug/metabolite transporter (DMT)-like permease
VCFNLNNLMEKMAVDRMPDISARRVGHMLKMLCTSRLWMLGFLLGVVAVGIMVVAYSLAPIAVVQSIFGAGLVLLVLASRLYLHEAIGRREWLGVAVIITAVVLVSVTLNSSNSPGVTSSNADVLIASVATTAFSALLFMVLRRSSAEASVPFGVASGLLYGVGSLQIKGASVLVTHHGVLGSIPRILTSPYPYLFVVMSVLGLLTFQTGLQRCRVGVVGPITNIVASIYVVAVGMVLFNEAIPHDTVLIVLRFSGFALVLAAGWIFAAGPAAAAQLGRALEGDQGTGPDGLAPAGTDPPDV